MLKRSIRYGFVCQLHENLHVFDFAIWTQSPCDLIAKEQREGKKNILSAAPESEDWSLGETGHVTYLHHVDDVVRQPKHAER